MMFNFRCPICGGMMVHHRLRGYVCHFESHNTQAHDMDLDAALMHVMSDDEITIVLNDAPPVEPSEGFRERALKSMREAGKRRAVKFN